MFYLGRFCVNAINVNMLNFGVQVLSEIGEHLPELGVEVDSLVAGVERRDEVEFKDFHVAVNFFHDSLRFDETDFVWKMDLDSSCVWIPSWKIKLQLQKKTYFKKNPQFKKIIFF